MRAMVRTCLPSIFSLTTHGARFSLAVVLGSSMVGCNIDADSVAPAVNPSRLVSYIESEFKTYNLSTVAPYDTVTLKIHGVSGTGTTLNLPVEFQYDTNVIDISSDGVLKAKAAVGSTPVVVSMSSEGATRYDTVQVGVIATSPTHLSRVAIEPEPGDSAKIALLYASRPPRKNLRLIRADSNNANVGSVLVSVQSSVPSVVSAIQSGNNVSVTPGRVGKSILRVSTFAYGLHFRDSLAFITGWPLISYAFIEEKYITGQATPVLRLGGTRIIVGIGGCVLWRNMSHEHETDIIFEDPSQALPADSAATIVRGHCQNNGGAGASPEGSSQGGNIQPFHSVLLPGGSVIDFGTAHRARAFTRAGIITFRSSKYDIAGTIIVCDEKNDSTCAPENYQWGIPER